MRHVFLLFLSFCNFISFGQLSDADFIQDRYTKSIYDIPMRDGNTLHTIVYSPKDTTQTYPFLMKRTCYGISPYSVEKMPSRLGPSPFLMRDLYIFVYQDVRGRYMSEGVFDNMRPHHPTLPRSQTHPRPRPTRRCTDPASPSTSVA